MDLNDLVQMRGEWMRGKGPEADIVMSSRIAMSALHPVAEVLHGRAVQHPNQRQLDLR